MATTDPGTPVVVAGTDFAAVRRLDSWWQVDAWPDAADGECCVAGSAGGAVCGE